MRLRNRARQYRSESPAPHLQSPYQPAFQPGIEPLTDRLLIVAVVQLEDLIDRWSKVYALACTSFLILLTSIE
jgi:hypothetical protein